MAGVEMDSYRIWECQVCGWMYDEAKGSPDDGLAPGTRWDDIPDDWVCPECGVGKEDFEMRQVFAPVAAATPVPVSKPVFDEPYQIWECQVCGWVYDEAKGSPDEGLAPGTRWRDIPDDWLCPECGVGKSDFEMRALSDVTLAVSAAPAPEVTSVAEITPAANWSQAPIVILGTGLAGYQLAKEIRKHSQTVPVLMISADDGCFYSKPVLSTGFSKGLQAKDICQKTAEEMARELDLQIYSFTRVEQLEPCAKRLLLDNGQWLEYSKLVLAVGAKANLPRINGADKTGLLSVNDLMDYHRVRTLLHGASAKQKRILVLGAGLIGCEYANDLVQAGYQVDVVDPMPHALASLLPKAAAEVLAEALHNAGVNFHFGVGVESLKRDDGVTKVMLSDGKQLEVDWVLSAIGVSPNTQLAAAAGMNVNRGIVTDRHLQTSEKDVFAIGDCAEVAGHVLVYIAPIRAQIQALAQTLLGDAQKVRYGVMPVTIKTSLHPVNVSLPPAGAEGHWRIELASATGVKACFVDANERLLGFALTGDQVRQSQTLAQQCPAVLP